MKVKNLGPACLVLLGLGGAAHGADQGAERAVAAELAPSAAAPPVLAAADMAEGADVQGKPPLQLQLEPANAQAGRYGSFQLLFRNYFEDLDVIKIRKQHAWVQAVQARYESPYTTGPVRFGFDLAPFAAIKLDGGLGARNMINLEPDGSGHERRGWAYLGTYVVKMKAPGVTLKYGLQPISNPYLEPYDIRALPPTYRGVSVVSDALAGLTLTAGSFDAVNARGATRLQSLSTGYGGTLFDRLSYVGGDWTDAGSTKLSVYAARAHDLWSQYYAAAERGFGDAETARWTGRADAYRTLDQGKRLQGPIRNSAYSLSGSVQHTFSTVTLGYQRMVGEQFFDFMNETSGIYLANSAGLDYNAPGERSLQLRYKLDGMAFGVPGLMLNFWKIRGWKADGSAEARRHDFEGDPLYPLYWKNGQVVHGEHREFGLQSKYKVQSGSFKDATVSFVFIRHIISPYYPSKDFRIFRLTTNIPFQVF